MKYMLNKIVYTLCLCFFCVISSFGQDEPITIVMDINHVMDAYIAAIGGKDKLAGIKDMTIIREDTSGGKNIKKIIRQINTPKETFFVVEGIADGKQSFRTIIEKNKLTVMSESSKQITEGKRANQVFNQAFLLIEPAYSQIGITPELDGVAKIDGKYAYRVKAMFENTPIYSFYDCESGLKVQVCVPGPKGMIFSSIEDYRKTDFGILYSHTVRNKDNVDVIVKIETNKGLKIEDFQ